ncbi:NAD(P)/FAD-dependent oxidoreductase [Pseudooceanicola marinus]|uniref:NAD(P)/FAD-dependent oxidoreductase n=1 Tax=Pseudooceanicola marinus TaxID=396013 RepID=UPI001C95385F|nr:FAD-dependent oxidoreductase [Pseudooceanicola marinus]MBY5971016.1 FAD-binding oxidoreductase [Ferrimonas balearica]MCA1334711.1 FAD-binding oxidoreductase [Pseudooceanicola marinus]
MKDLGEWDIVVIGGGLVGTATALGMARDGARVLILDAADTSFRASRGNFGLVWAQSKGAGSRDYATWTRSAVRDWTALQDELRELSGVDTHYQTGMGLHLCLGEAEYDKRAAMIGKVAAHDLPGDDVHMIDHDEVAEILPGIGPEVTGASVSSLDGACHSLSLYRGLSLAAQAAGATLISNVAVTAIKPQDAGYLVEAAELCARADRVLIAAGLATNALAEPFGFPKIVKPQKGQILVTERADPVVPVVTSGIRQTPEGTILIGDTKEETDEDRSTGAGMSQLARRAARLFPAIGKLRIVRSWAALRVLTPDGFPVYDESPTHPGVFVATTHSGVTLAPAHRGPLAQWILNGQKPPEFSSFTAQRFQQETEAPTG